jgi:predicted membrane protein
MDTPTAGPLSTSAPDESRAPRFTGRLIIGLAIIVVGVLFLLDAFDVPGTGEVWHYVRRLWPVVFLLIGLTKLTNSRSSGDYIGAGIWIVIGSLLLANNFDLISFDIWRAFWPALLILFGVSMVARAADVRYVSRRARGQGGASGAADTGSRTSAIALLSGATRRLSSPDFQGGDATAIMGGCEIDLRQCSILSSPAVFDAFALMGGVELKIPGDWTVRNEGLAILGAIEDNRKETAGNPAKVLILRGAAIMGGIEIKN